MYSGRVYQQNYDAVLASFEVTPANLHLNRDNRLAPEQASRLRAESIRITVFICLAIVGLAAVTLLTAPLAPSDLYVLFVVFGLLTAVMIGLNIGLTLLALSPSAVSKREGVMVLYGPPEGLTPRPNALGMPLFNKLRIQQRGIYRIIIDDVMLRITEKQYTALRSFAGVYFRLYFVPTINRIVAVERYARPDSETTEPPIDLESVDTSNTPAHPGNWKLM